MANIDALTIKMLNLIIRGAKGELSNVQVIEKEIAKWINSPERIMQIKGHLYYNNEHDIMHRKRTMIGENGELQEVNNLPNNRVIDNQYGKLVNQKTDYLLAKPFVVECKNKNYEAMLKKVFNKRFMRTLKNAGKSALNSGICWLYPYYDKKGELAFRLFPGYEILPFWKDSEHNELECAVRLYSVMAYEGTTQRIIQKVEVYDNKGIHCYILDGGNLVQDITLDDYECAYVTANGQPLNWERIPLIAIKYNENEIPLLKKVKSLQDGINAMISDYENAMQEDARNTILVLKNLDGQNLGEFRKNLATFGAVKVRYDEQAKGGVETLEVQVNSENYKSILQLLKKAVIENGMGYDAKDDRLGGNANQMNIQSMYSDIDLDANDMETELQAAFEEILWFVNIHLANTGKGNFENEEVNIIFNRDILINEGEAIENCRASVGILSDETIISQHPWVDDVQKELDRLKKQRETAQAETEAEYNPFDGLNKGGEEDEEQ